MGLVGLNGDGYKQYHMDAEAFHRALTNAIEVRNLLPGMCRLPYCPLLPSLLHVVRLQALWFVPCADVALLWCP